MSFSCCIIYHHTLGGLNNIILLSHGSCEPGFWSSSWLGAWYWQGWVLLWTLNLARVWFHAGSVSKMKTSSASNCSDILSPLPRSVCYQRGNKHPAHTRAGAYAKAWTSWGQYHREPFQSQPAPRQTLSLGLQASLALAPTETGYKGWGCSWVVQCLPSMSVQSPAPQKNKAKRMQATDTLKFLVPTLEKAKSIQYCFIHTKVTV